MFYTLLLFAATLLPWAAGMSGVFYLGGAVVLGLVFVWYAWKLQDPPDDVFAMRVFNYSVIYLMALFVFLLIDHWLMPWLGGAGLRAGTGGLSLSPAGASPRPVRPCGRRARTRA